MQYGNILGDVTESSHTNWIELTSVQWGVSRAATNLSGSVAQRNLAAPRVTELVVSKPQDIASVPLIQESLSGMPKTVKIDFARTGQDQTDVYYSISLSETVITAFTQAAATDRPSETITLSFVQISFQGTQMDSDGSGTSPSNCGWNVAQNTPI